MRCIFRRGHVSHSLLPFTIHTHIDGCVVYIVEALRILYFRIESRTHASTHTHTGPQITFMLL